MHTETCSVACTDLLMNPDCTKEVSLIYFTGFWVIGEDTCIVSASITDLQS